MLHHAEDWHSNVCKCFDEIDEDHSGTITMGELRTFSHVLYSRLRMKEVLPLAKMVRLFNALDADHSGVLDLSEFMNLTEKLMELCHQQN